MKYLSTVLAVGLLTSCSSYQVADQKPEISQQSNPVCIGSTQLPAQLAPMFKAIEDPVLLNKALGQPNQGKLCQGQVYQLKTGATLSLYRAWNSTNPNSKMGNWWAFEQPDGKVSQYRADYEICYQWSPLDKLVRCSLKPGTKVVVGNGQSATCSQYLTYPVSAQQQVYLDDAANSTQTCDSYEGYFKWQ